MRDTQDPLAFSMTFETSASFVATPGDDPPREWMAMEVSEALAEICDRLADQQGVAFHVAGFGDDRWPVGIWGDLAIAVEQVPEVLGRLRSNRRFELDFFEQGVERSIAGEPIGSMVHLTCSSGTDWQPVPARVCVDRASFDRMITAFLRAFRDAAVAVLPAAARQPALDREVWVAL